MADQEEIATGSEAGAGENTQLEGTESTSQEAGQSQTTEHANTVDSASTNASSNSAQGRNNPQFVLQRQIEKAVKKTLQTSLKEQLAPLIESLRGQQANPPAPTNQTQDEDAPDFQNLSTWVNKRVNTLLQQALQKELPNKFNQFKGELTSTFKSETGMQEARNYLISQKDIGRDQAKLDEIKQVIEDNLWGYALEHEPLRTTERAVAEWRRSKTNPNTPAKGQLTTVAGGGASTTAKKPISTEDLKKLQLRLTQNPTTEEMEEISKQIELAVSA